MIKSFKHKGLERFFHNGDISGIQAKHKEKLKKMLGVLDEAEDIKYLNRPSYQLHRLHGDRKKIWSVKVNANWRLTFEFENGNVYILDYEDYH